MSHPYLHIFPDEMKSHAEKVTHIFVSGKLLGVNIQNDILKSFGTTVDEQTKLRESLVDQEINEADEERLRCMDTIRGLLISKVKEIDRMLDELTKWKDTFYIKFLAAPPPARTVKQVAEAMKEVVNGSEILEWNLKLCLIFWEFQQLVWKTENGLVDEG